MDKKSENYKGVNPALQGIVWGGAAASIAMAAYDPVSKTIGAMDDGLLKKTSTVAAVAVGALASFTIACIANHSATEAKQQFQENQSTINEQAHIISEAESQGLIQTHTTVTKGSAF